MTAHPHPTVIGDGPRPRPLEDGEQPFHVYDPDGNPLCPGCFEGPLMFAARANSGRGRCGCPTGDRRLPDVTSKADALLFIQAALDKLEEGRHQHPLICVCGLCEAYRILTGGRF